MAVSGVRYTASDLPPQVSRHFPPDIVEQLRSAVAVWPRSQLEKRIDALTDELVARGLCRARGDVAEPWRGQWAGVW